MSLTSEPPRFNHSLSNTSTTSFLAAHSSTSANSQPPTESTPTSASPAHSSPASSTSSSASTSGSSDRLGRSSVLGSSSMLSKAGSAASLTTVASPDSSTNSIDTPAKPASPALEPKDVPPQVGASFNDRAGQPKQGMPKLRRASTTSSDSSSTPQEANMSRPALQGSRSASGVESTRPHRKAARMGSFDARPSSRSASSSTNGGTENDQDGDDEAEPGEDANGSTDVPTGPSDVRTGALSSTPAEPPRPSSSSPHPNTSPTTNHVEIVSYPSADLLRLLASLLEQIAHANDALHQRAASGSGSRPRSGQQTPAGNEEPNGLERGMFDAAPLNSPITPLARPHMGDIHMREREAEQDEQEEEEEEMPVTPGVDLLREVGAGGGVDGFMPSLGGTHYPVPLARRRGSSFLRARDDTASAAPSYNRTRSSGGTVTGPSISAAGPLPGSIPPGTTPPATNSFPAANGPPPVSEPPLTSLLTASSVALSSPSATLCFHARNIPAISIEAYLLRILKYCPTTNEVFLSLLVYFDRMARVGLEAQRIGLVNNNGRGRTESSDGSNRMFAIDSFNIHRLVIAGVTVASKFFSDVFYTNSRYAKVGGLPLNELNQLELQFLLLNDFRLVIPVDELQRYADQLILYWVGRNASPGANSNHPHPGSPRPSIPQQPTQAVQQLTAPLTTAAVAQQAEQAQQPRRPSPGQHVGSSFTGGSAFPGGAPANRPRSVRSQPSSSGTSVTSTVTPGTPSTPRGGGSGWGDESGTEGSEAESGAQGEPMEED